MRSPPKIIQVRSFPDRTIEVTYANGKIGQFNFEDFFEYRGLYSFLKNNSSFLKIMIEPKGQFVYWTNEETQEEIEIDPNIMYSICFNEKIIHENNVVFDPSLGKNAWIR